MPISSQNHTGDGGPTCCGQCYVGCLIGANTDLRQTGHDAQEW